MRKCGDVEEIVGDMSAKYLDIVRQKNKTIASQCFYCNKKSAEINAIKHRIVFVCKKHKDEDINVILDTSMPGVIHYIYPEGKKVSEKMMDPNVGGFYGNKK